MATNTPNHPATLRQIVTDMHQITLFPVAADIVKIASAVRALAELLLSQQPSGKDGADLAPTLIRSPRDAARRHFDEAFGAKP